MEDLLTLRTGGPGCFKAIQAALDLGKLSSTNYHHQNPNNVERAKELYQNQDWVSLATYSAGCLGR